MFSCVFELVTSQSIQMAFHFQPGGLRRWMLPLMRWSPRENDEPIATFSSVLGGSDRPTATSGVTDSSPYSSRAPPRRATHPPASALKMQVLEPAGGSHDLCFEGGVEPVFLSGTATTWCFPVNVGCVLGGRNSRAGCFSFSGLDMRQRRQKRRTKRSLHSEKMKRPNMKKVAVSVEETATF